MADRPFSKTFRWQAGCRCCTGSESPCLIVDDNFDQYPDDTLLDDTYNWNASGGPFRVTAGEVTAIDNGTCRTIKKNTTDYDYLECKLQAVTSGYEVRCFVHSEEDGSAYLYASIERLTDGESDYTIRIGQHVAGGGTVYAEDTVCLPDGWVDVRLCVAPGQPPGGDMVAIFNAKYELKHEGVPDTSSVNAGFANMGANKEAKFDDFHWEVHQQPGQFEKCPSCGTVPTTCLVCEDDFDEYPDLTEPPHPWRTSHEDVITDAGRLLVPAAQWAYCCKQNPVQPAIVQATVTLSNEVAPKARVCCQWLDADNYRFAEIEVTDYGTPCTYYRIGERLAGVDTILKDKISYGVDSRGTPVAVKICEIPDNITLDVRVTQGEFGSVKLVEDSKFDLTGRSGGFTAISSFAWFDDFVHTIQSTADPLEYIICPNCYDPPPVGPCQLFSGWISGDGLAGPITSCLWETTPGVVSDGVLITVPNGDSGRLLVAQDENDWDMTASCDIAIEDATAAFSLRVYVNANESLAGSFGTFSYNPAADPSERITLTTSAGGSMKYQHVLDGSIQYIRFTVCLQDRPTGNPRLCANALIGGTSQGPCVDGVGTFNDSPFSGFEATSGTVKILDTWTFTRGNDATCPTCKEYLPLPDCWICSDGTMPADVTVTFPPVGDTGGVLPQCSNQNCHILSDNSPWVLDRYVLNTCWYIYDASPELLFCGSRYILIRFVEDPVGGGGKIQFVIDPGNPINVIYEKVYPTGTILDCSNLDETLTQVGDLLNNLCIWPPTITLTS